MALFHPYNALLPEVTLRFGDWIKLCSPTIVENISNAIYYGEGDSGLGFKRVADSE